MSDDGHGSVPAWIPGDNTTRAWLRHQLASRLSLASAISIRLDPDVNVSVLAQAKTERARLARLDTGGIWDGPGLSRVKELVIGIVGDFLLGNARGAAVFEHSLLKPGDPVVGRLPKKAFAGDEVYSWVDASGDEATIRAAVVNAWNFRFAVFLTTEQPLPQFGISSPCPRRSAWPKIHRA